jgi:hypothetical protein
MYRNHNNAFLVSDDDIARYHGHFATRNGDLNFYTQTIRNISELIAANHREELSVAGGSSVLTGRVVECLVGLGVHCSSVRSHS